MKNFIEKLIEKLEEVRKNTLTASVRWAYDKAIKIVNQLAEEYNNDFCEWEKVNVQVGLPFYKSCKRAMPYNMNDDKQYCPFCGKKIKVVE